MKATVGERGQVTIPKRLRERLGIRPGQRLDFEEEGGKLVVTKDPEGVDPTAGLYGILTLPRDVDQLIEEMRGPADLGHEP